MMRPSRPKFLRLVIVLFLTAICVPAVCSGQTLEEKLRMQTDFVPRSAGAIEQLIEVAQKFKIRMGIELISDEVSPDSRLEFPGGSVMDLFTAIVWQLPGHAITREGEMLHVFEETAVSSPLNFLNVRIPEYSVTERNLLAAGSWLSRKITITLFPEAEQLGWAGGYGGDPESSFWIPNITFSGFNLTVRQILTGIAERNGRAIWVAKLSREELTGSEPRWVRMDNRWFFREIIYDPLEEETEFLPQSESPVDQLIEVAREFKIGMDIEWVDQPKSRAPAPLSFSRGTVRDLISAILSRRRISSLHMVTAVGRHRVRIQSSPFPDGMSSPLNFLNLRIPEFNCAARLTESDELLKNEIDKVVFRDVHDLSGFENREEEGQALCLRTNETVREILSTIARRNGNLIWVVTLNQDEFMRDKPIWEGEPIDEDGHSSLVHRWQFIPLDK